MSDDELPGARREATSAAKEREEDSEWTDRAIMRMSPRERVAEHLRGLGIDCHEDDIDVHRGSRFEDTQNGWSVAGKLDGHYFLVVSIYTLTNCMKGVRLIQNFHREMGHSSGHVAAVPIGEPVGRFETPWDGKLNAGFG